MAKSAADVTAKWATRTKGAVADWAKGVDGVTSAPGAAAAAKANEWQQKLQQTETLEKYRTNVGAVTLGEWKERTKSKGQGRIAAGVDAAVPGFQSFMGEFLPFAENVSAECKAMAGVTLEDGVNRAVTAIRRLATFRRTRR